MSDAGRTPVDAFGARQALHGPEHLRPFAAVGVLEAADVHLAATLCRLGGETSPTVALAAALACRAVRHGSVTVDLETVAGSVTVGDGGEVDVAELPWPDPASWLIDVRRSDLVADGDDVHVERGDRIRPLRLLGTRLALDRYWRHEVSIAAWIRARVDVDTGGGTGGGDDGFAEGDEDQRRAIRTAASHRFSVIAGGPGTGKTTAIAALLARLHTTGSARVALAAPTGKAAARLTEAVHHHGRRMLEDGRVSAEVAESLLATTASTLHRLLGRRPGSNSRFRHDAANRLPHDVIVVDETSMVSLSMMARLLEAVRDDARLVLVGDPRQLASVEAGAVLGDVVAAAVPGSSLAEHVVVLEHVHRFAGTIGRLATAVVEGDADAALEALASGDDVSWIDADVGTADGHDEAVTAMRSSVVDTATAVVTAAGDGEAAAALAAMASTQILCAHRRGPYGVSWWRREVERWLIDSIDGYSPHGWFAGRPLLVTENDYALGLFNGDTGVVVADGSGLTCAFERRGEIIGVSPSRLRAIETLYAMTIHKSQGSQFTHPVVVLPEASSPILTRELFYTAVTRASERVTVVGTEEAIRAAIARPVQRASGLSGRLS